LSRHAACLALAIRAVVAWRAPDPAAAAVVDVRVGVDAVIAAALHRRRPAASAVAAGIRTGAYIVAPTGGLAAFLTWPARGQTATGDVVANVRRLTTYRCIVLQ
jgi:hypothetical protein